MLAFFGFIILLLTLFLMGFFAVNLLVTTFTIAALLIVFGVAGVWSWWLLIPVWLIAGVIFIPLNAPVFRRNLISKKMLRYFKSVQPPMSKTEQIALEAGDTWWEAELFQGKPNWEQLNNFKKPTLTEEEQAFLDNEVETLCGLLDDWKIVHEAQDLSPAAWQYLKDQRFFGLVIAKKYGGHGFSALAHSTIVTKIATRSMSAAVNTMVPNSLGPAELIGIYGTDEQKNHYLPRLAKGIDIPCFGLTGLEAGSDATAISDTAVICRGEFNGESIIGVRLNWYKRYITLAPVATLLGLAVKLYDPEHLVGDKEDLGITLFLIPANLPGISIGQRHSPLQVAFMNGPMQGKDVFVPLDYIIGGASKRGEGWKMLMECLGIGRGISLPALGTAAAKLSYRTAGAYARVRKQFKMAIGKLEGIQEPLARIAGLTYIAEATRLMTVSAVDQHLRPSLASAISKYHLTEISRQVINDAFDIHAGKAIQLGPKNYLGLVHNAIPVSITVEGANILTRNLIIFGQGAMRCHPFVLKEMQAAQDPNPETSLKKFDKLLFGHLGFTIRNLFRSFTFGLFGTALVKAPKSPLNYYYRQCTRMSSALALSADVAMAMLGGELKRRERLSARLGDVLSYLYLASSALRYFENQQRPLSDINLAEWSLQYCLAKMQTAFHDFYVNFPHPLLGNFLYRLLFPWGSVYKMPSDQLDQRVAEAMQRPSELRDRLTQHAYLGKAGDGIYELEQAFIAVVGVEPIKLKIQNAIRGGRLPRHASQAEQYEVALKAGILTANEIQSLHDAHALYLQAIAVDEFDSL